jgi:nucleoside-diphosphate-sugar epimerase
MHLITGGTGIVGAHLLHRLTVQGEVRALRRAGSDLSVVERIFRHYGADHAERLQRIRWVEGDLHDMPALEDAMAGVEQVYHAAALVSFDPRDLRRLRHVNVQGTANVVNAALLAGVRRLCHVSSTAAMGHSPTGPVDESLPWAPEPHTSGYAWSKYEAELEVQRGIAEGLDAVIANPSVILGPGAAGRSSMTLSERLRKGSRFHPSGSNGFVDARDVADALITLMDRGATGERYLLVGSNVPYAELFRRYCEGFGHPAPQRVVAPWMLAVAWRLERLRTLLTGGRPLVTRYTVHSACAQRSYSTTKAQALGITFRPLQESVDNVIRYLTGSA